MQDTAPNISGDGGLLLLEKLDKRHGTTKRMATCLTDSRRGDVLHTPGEMLVQRVYGIAMGWEDCNDFDALRQDRLYSLPPGSLSPGYLPASQPTLSRFENAVRMKDLYFLVVGIPSNSVLKQTTEPLMFESRAKRDETKHAARIYGEFAYEAGMWDKERRIIVKAEALPERDNAKAKDNTRFVVTNMAGDPETLYLIYCQRGQSENRIKEMKIDLASGRTSCYRFLANTFRLMLHAIAFALLNRVRDHLCGTELAQCTLGHIRLKLLKIAAIVQESTRRFLIRLDRGHTHIPFVMQLLAN